MSLHLLIETSSKNCSVALAENENVICCVESAADQYIHAEKLHPFISELFTSSGKEISALDSVVVSKGPGSYTGLRIGVSAAKGLCLSLGKPLLSIDTTRALAVHGAKEFPGYEFYLPMIDARRMEVYCALYDHDLMLKEAVSAKIVATDFFMNLDVKKTLFIGDGAPKCLSFMEDQTSIVNVLPSAKMMATDAHSAFLAGRFEDLAQFEPFYLKDFMPGISTKAIL